MSSFVFVEHGCLFIYRPHWHISGNSLRSRQATYVKASTAFSWELDETAKARVPSDTVLRATDIHEVQSMEEASRHEHSREHLEVALTPRSKQLVVEGHAVWYVYMPHWIEREELEANCNTWLKRSTGMSWDLAADEKVAVTEGEVIKLLSGPRRIANHAEATRHAHAGEHREIVLLWNEIERLRLKAPRLPLCKYFSSDADALFAELSQCFMDPRFGPGVPPPLQGTLCAQKYSGGSKLGMLLPHGGYCNSGYVAAHGFQLLAESGPCHTAIIVGNNHQSWHKFALSDQTWETPLGPVEPALPIVQELQGLGYRVNREVHAEEHSIENQLPFLRFVRPGIKIVPVGVGSVTLHEAEELAGHIARLAQEHDATLFGTTDFSHEGPSYGGPALGMEEVTELTRQKDLPLLQSVEDMDVARLLRLSKRSSMCGPGSASVFLLACHALGLTRVQKHRYLVNTEVTPCNSTTGFATFSFHAPGFD